MSGGAICGPHLYDNPAECPCPECGERAVILDDPNPPHAFRAHCLKNKHNIEMKPGTKFRCLKCDREEVI